jgi:hypothetical protein
MAASGQLNQPVQVQEPQLNLVVSYTASGSTNQVKPAHVRLTYQTIAGATCSTYTYSPTINSSTGPTAPATGWLANPGQPFASNQATGTMASAASTSSSPQTASYSVCVDYNSYYAKTTTAVYNDNMTSPTAVTLTVVKGTNSGVCP